MSYRFITKLRALFLYNKYSVKILLCFIFLYTNISLAVTDEEAIGDLLIEQLNASGHVCKDYLLRDYLQNFGSKVALRADPNKQAFHFHCINSEQLNAFAFLGHNIAIYTGLVTELSSEEELASIIAHEVAHITQRHIEKSEHYSNQRFWITMGEIIAAAMMKSPELAYAALAHHMHELLHFSREQETEADRISISTLNKLHYNSYALIDTLTKLENRNNFNNTAPEYLLTHPIYTNRIANATNFAAQYPYKQKPSSIDFYLMQKRIFIQQYKTNQANMKALEQKLLQEINNKSYANETAALYHYACVLNHNKNFTAAQAIILELLKKHPNNFILKFTLFEIEKNINLKLALDNLNNLMLSNNNNRASIINYAMTLLEEPSKDNASNAKNLLTKHEDIFTNDPNYFKLLVQIEAMLGHNIACHEANARYFELLGYLERSIQQLDIALETAKDPVEIKRLNAYKTYLIGKLNKRSSIF